MARLEVGGGRWLEFPLISSRGVDAEIPRLFDEAARAIQREWRVRSVSRKRDLSWLKRSCYVVITEMLALDQTEFFGSRIRAHGRYARGKKGRPNIFQTGLMAIFADDREALNGRAVPHFRWPPKLRVL